MKMFLHSVLFKRKVSSALHCFYYTVLGNPRHTIVCRLPPAFRPLASNQEAPCSARGGFTASLVPLFCFAKPSRISALDNPLIDFDDILSGASVFDLSGRCVYKVNFDANARSFTINTKKLPLSKGTYIFKVFGSHFKERIAPVKFMVN